MQLPITIYSDLTGLVPPKDDVLANLFRSVHCMFGVHLVLVGCSIEVGISVCANSGVEARWPLFGDNCCPLLGPR